MAATILPFRPRRSLLGRRPPVPSPSKVSEPERRPSSQLLDETVKASPDETDKERGD